MLGRLLSSMVPSFTVARHWAIISWRGRRSSAVATLGITALLRPRVLPKQILADVHLEMSRYFRCLCFVPMPVGCWTSREFGAGSSEMSALPVE